MSNEKQKYINLKEILSAGNDEGENVIVVLRGAEIHKAQLKHINEDYVTLSGSIKMIEVTSRSVLEKETKSIMFPVTEIQFIYLDE